MIPIAPIMAATTTVLLANQRKNKEYEERKRKEQENRKEEREIIPKIVDNITVTYTDGSTRTLRSGLALDVLNEEEIQVDETNLKDEDIVKLINVLISYAEEKDLI